MKVFILTYCQQESALYGNELIFKTLRTGFPTAHITVFDNNSIRKASIKFAELANELGCEFFPISYPITHAEFIQTTLYQARDSEEPIVFLDPDLIFWENCESFDIKGLFAGRFMNTFYDSYTDCYTNARLHTSFLWIPSPKELVNKSIKVMDKYFDVDFVDPFMFMRPNGDWERFDTMSLAFRVFEKDTVRFNEDMLNSYDHIFCGTHLHLVKQYYPELIVIHERIKDGDLEYARGIWKLQDSIIDERRIAV